MEAGDPRFPEYPGWGPPASRVPSLPPHPPPQALDFFLLPCPPGATGLRGAQSVPGALLPLPTPATLLETQLPRPSFPLGAFPVRAGERVAWRRGLGGLRGASGSDGGPGERLRGSWCPGRSAGRGAGAGRARWRVPGTHAARSFFPAAPRDAVAAAVRRPPSSCSRRRRRADPRWLRAPWSPTASFPPPG